MNTPYAMKKNNIELVYLFDVMESHRVKAAKAMVLISILEQVKC